MGSGIGMEVGFAQDTGMGNPEAGKSEVDGGLERGAPFRRVSYIQTLPASSF